MKREDDDLRALFEKMDRQIDFTVDRLHPCMSAIS